MRFYIFLLSLLFTAIATYSQTPENLLKGGEDEASRQAIQNFKSTPLVQAFKICLFIGSDQNARSEAKQSLELCYSSFPDIEGDIVYEAPIFKVLVGACVDRIEATRLLARLQPSFPKAFVMSCSIPITDFLKKEMPDTTQVQADDLEGTQNNML